MYALSYIYIQYIRGNTNKREVDEDFLPAIYFEKAIEKEKKKTESRVLSPSLPEDHVQILIYYTDGETNNSNYSLLLLLLLLLLYILYITTSLKRINRIALDFLSYFS